MRKSRISACWLVACLGAAISPAGAQILAPEEIKDPAARGLQRKYLGELKAIAAEIGTHRFQYPFYFSRALGLELDRQRRGDQRSIRFEKYKGRMMLQMTGNYYASYSTELMDRGQRARQTFVDVMQPLLQATVPRLASSGNSFEGYALEISHHVRQKVMGVSAENTENVVLILPRAAAERLTAAKTPAEQQSAIEEGQAFVNAEPCSLPLAELPPTPRQQPASGGGGANLAARRPERVPAAAAEAAPPPGPAKPPEPPARLVTKERLAALVTANQELLARLVKELEGEAHFVSYAPPVFIPFRQGAYLQLSITTLLEASAAGSRYKLAALAFDEHIARLIRPVLAYFPKDSEFDGIDFSTSVRLPDAPSSLAIEFIFPFSALRAYAQYDCTGQQLINSGFVLINGERVGLDLQAAEAAR